MAPSILALDVGGANLKAAHTAVDMAWTQPFALWKDPGGLADALRDLLRELPPFDRLTLTMTGELCDCFATRREGVMAILEAVAGVAGSAPVAVWSIKAEFVTLETARSQPLLVAASNWLALATFAGRYAPEGAALLLDIGSTTTDIVPLLDGWPVPHGRLDPERLRSGELVYTGVERTPVCALLGGDGAAELFATTADVYLVLGKIAENTLHQPTADGRPSTRDLAHARLARMMCADVETSTPEERRGLALRTAHRQIALLKGAVQKVSGRLPRQLRTVVLSGSGEFLGRSVLETELPTVPAVRVERVVSLTQELGPETSRAACAYALTVLASEAGG